jgi:hypothetical protein
MASAAMTKAVSKPKVTSVGVEIVVDGFGDADNVDALVKEIARNVLRAVAAGDDHGVDTETPGVLHTQGRVIANDFLAVLHGFVGKMVAAIGGAKNCAATRQNAADGFFREFLSALGPDEPIKAVADADDAYSVLVDSGANNGANGSVESGSVAAAVDDTDRTHRFHIYTLTESIDKFKGLHELAYASQDTREEVESEEDSE